MTLARELAPSSAVRHGISEDARWVSIRQIAADLGVSTSTVYKWSARGAPWFPRSIRLHNGDVRVRRDWYESLRQLEHGRNCESDGPFWLQELFGLEIEWKASGEIPLGALFPRVRQPRPAKSFEPLAAVRLAFDVPAIDLPSADLTGGPVGDLLNSLALDDPGLERPRSPWIPIAAGQCAHPSLRRAADIPWLRPSVESRA